MRDRGRRFQRHELAGAAIFLALDFTEAVAAEGLGAAGAGMLLGIVVYHTRSIFGGLMVHLGIAWLMEIGGYFGHSY